MCHTTWCRNSRVDGALCKLIVNRNNRTEGKSYVDMREFDDLFDEISETS